MSAPFRSLFTAGCVHNSPVITRVRRLSAAGAGIVAVMAMVPSPVFALDRAAPVPAVMAKKVFPDDLFAVAAARANPQPGRSDTGNGRHSSKVTDSELRVALDAWQLANRTYKAALAVRAAAVVKINETFTARVKHAKADLEAVRSQANTPAAKSAAAARFADAVSVASAIRQAALDSLPPLPPSPGPKPTLRSLATLRQQAAAAAGPFAG